MCVCLCVCVFNICLFKSHNVLLFQLFHLKIFHQFKTQTVNEHVPKVCQFCGDIIWNCAKLCTDCCYICHVECQSLVTSHCESRIMYRETKSVGECTRDYAVGDARLLQNASPCTSPISSRTMSPASELSYFGKTSACNDTAELDLTYITDRLIAMSFPASGLESVYHTSLLKVLKMLQTKHLDRYKIINVSERRYDILQLNEPGQVIDYGWPDHLAPTLDKLHKIIKSIHAWLLGDIKNVAVIHCKGGKSRIGVVIASYIQFSKNSPSPQGALDWFALRRYYDSKLEGATQPSQKRYVHYLGSAYEKKFTLTGRRLFFQNIIMHGIPYFGNSTGFQFCLKIYQAYLLKHTTKTYCVSPSSKRAYVSIEDGVQLHGDIMVKCIEKGSATQNVIFRLQFHTDAVDGCVAVFGKYDLDEAFKDPRFPDSCYIEFVFAPGDEEQRKQEQAACIDSRLQEVTTQHKHSFTSELDDLINKMSSPQPGKTIGIFDIERQMTGMVETTKNLTNPKHVAGPVDGNPYAQIDPILKEKLRARPSMPENDSYNLTTGIEDLDNLLGEINYLATKADVNGNTYASKKIDTVDVTDHAARKSRSSVTKHAPPPVEGKITMQQCGILHQAPSLQLHPAMEGKITVEQRRVLHQAPGVQHKSVSDDVFSNSPSASTVDDLLYELDHSPLNSSYGMRKPLKRNASSYDNDSVCSGSESDQHILRSDTNRNDSVDGIMEIYPGMVAQHVRNLNKVLFTEENEYQRKYGVPLAGFNAPDVVQQKVTKFNSRSVAPGYCSSPPSQIYHSQGGMTKINYEHQPDHVDAGTRQPVLFDHSKENGHVLHDSDFHDMPSDDMSLPSHHEDQDYSSKTGTLLSRSDSAYGESMRSSSPSPVMTPVSRSYDGHLDGPFTHVSTYSSHEERVGNSYSPRSDTNNNGKSSGIGSRTSSITSLEYEEDGAGYVKVDDIKRQPLVHKTVAQTEPEVPVEYVPVKGKSESTLDIIPIQLKAVPAVETIPYQRPTKRTLTVVEEHIQPAHIQREVECLNEDIFKHLLADDLKRTNEVGMPTYVMPTYDDRLTTSSNEDEVHISGDVLHRKQPNTNTIKKSTTNSSSRREENRFLSSDTDHSFENGYGVHLVDKPTFERAMSCGSSASDEPSSPRSPGRYVGTLRTRRRGGSGSSNSSISSAELFHEVSRYPSIKFDKDTMGLWYKPNISRDEATNLLREKEPGAFVVRDSQSYEGAFGLAVKVETPPLGVLQQVGGDLSKIDLDNELVRHFLIEPCKKGVRLKGSNNEPAFPSLVALIYQHTLTKMALPVPLIIPEIDSVDGAANGMKSSLTESQLLEKGAACNLVYLGAVGVESLTGDGAVHYAMNKVTSQNMTQKTTTINIKVNQQGITLTDNQRRLFFRRHYQMANVIHCGVDPKGRQINLKPIIGDVDREVGCFGFVVRKQSNNSQNECHICAEMDPDQPASAVINFIHKAMRYAKV